MDKSILRNVAINIVGLMLPTFVSLATVPAYIRLLGVERYGVVSLVWTLIGYFSVLDFGMSTAAQNQISKARASSDAGECELVFWSATWLNLATGVIGGVIIYFGAFLYTAYFARVSVDLQHEVFLALPWLAIAIPIANVSWVFAGAINGAERFGVFNSNQTVGTFLFQLLPLAMAALAGPTLQNVLAAAVVARVLAALLLGRSAFLVLGIRRIQAPRLIVAKGLFSFGGWMLISSVTNMLAQSLDRVLLGTQLGARYVTYYTVPQNLVTRLSIVPNALTQTLFPRLSAVGRDHADVLTRQSLDFLSGVFTPIALVAIFVIEPFLHAWVGGEIATAAGPVGRILVVSIWLVGQASVTRILIQSQIGPAIAARVGLFELPIFVGMLWLGVVNFGLTGAAVAVAGRSLFDYGALLWLSHHRARATALHMTAHLVFLLGALWLTSFNVSLSTILGTGALMVVANLVWSIAVTSASRELVQALLVKISVRKRA